LVKLDSVINSLAMKLFPRRDASADPPAGGTDEVPVLPPPKVTIPLSDELKTMLETPVDPRVRHLLEKINEDKVTTAKSQPRRVIGFTPGDELKQVRAESDTETPLPDSL
jgi:hypothetical protein